MNSLDLGYALTALVTAPWWMRKARSGWGERLARVLPEVGQKEPGRPRVMLHAVSVGEVNSLRELVPRLGREAEVVVTASTDTGIARARELFSGTSGPARPGALGAGSGSLGGCVVARYPLDASWAVGRFLDRVEPDVVGLVELEVWPNFVRACHGRGVPVAVINGRLSERSFWRYRRVSRWVSPSFAALSAAAVQDDAYAERFWAMGVPRDRVVVTGSMKFDTARIEDGAEGAEALAIEMGIDRSRPLIVAGSTGPGEEALLRGACESAFGAGGVQLLCAPRKPERFDEAAAALPGCVRRSRCRSHAPHSLGVRSGLPVASDGHNESGNARTEVRDSEGGGGRAGGASSFLLDTIGELRTAYALADLVVVGRSFFDLHGSDPIEPIGLGKATVIGPSTSDFAEIVRALAGAGGLVVSDRSSLAGTLADLLPDAHRRGELAARGRACVRMMRGASERHAELLLWLAGEGPSHPGEGPGGDAAACGALSSPSTPRT